MRHILRSKLRKPNCVMFQDAKNTLATRDWCCLTVQRWVTETGIQCTRLTFRCLVWPWTLVFEHRTIDSYRGWWKASVHFQMPSKMYSEKGTSLPHHPLHMVAIHSTRQRPSITFSITKVLEGALCLHRPRFKSWFYHLLFLWLWASFRSGVKSEECKLIKNS